MWNELLTWYQAIIGVVPGISGALLRAHLLRPFAQKIGSGVKIKESVQIWDLYKFSIGADSGIGRYGQLNAVGGIDIGTDVMIGPFVMITTANHGLRTGTPLRRQPLQIAPVTIGDNVWIGGHVSILPGVTINSGAIVGAGAVVTRNVAPDTIVAGVPAILKNRRT
jgi:maltose O-acetyltransferase